MSKTLYLVRHGESYHNAWTSDPVNVGQLYTHEDPYTSDLNEVGRQQAKELALQFEYPFDAVFMSQLQRVQNTCNIFLDTLQSKIIPTVDERLDEYKLSSSGHEFSRAEHSLQTKMYPDILKHQIDVTYDFSAFGGDTGEFTLHKITSFINDIKQLPYEHILIFTSSGIIRAAYKTLLKDIAPISHRYIRNNNCRVHVFKIN